MLVALCSLPTKDLKLKEIPECSGLVYVKGFIICTAT